MKPNPGTPKAIQMGCTCPVMDNCYGRGYMGMRGMYIYNSQCPVHGQYFKEAAVKLEKASKRQK